MHWLGAVQRGLRDGALDGSGGGAEAARRLRLELFVYEKCADAAEDSWPRLGWQHERRIYLANKGEECYAFLSYLRDMYDYLPDAVLFFQGDGVLGGAGFEAKARAFSAEMHALAPRPFTQAWRSVNDHQYVGIGASIEECHRLLSVPQQCANVPQRLFDCIQATYEEHLSDHAEDGRDEDDGSTQHQTAASPSSLKPPPRAFAVYTNAQFGVTRDRILERPLALYDGLLAEFERDDSQACYRVGGKKARPHCGTCALLEFLWPTSEMKSPRSSLLSPPPS